MVYTSSFAIGESQYAQTDYSVSLKVIYEEFSKTMAVNRCQGSWKIDQIFT